MDNKKELREAEREVHQAVWPNVNDAMDLEHVRNLKKQIRDLEVRSREEEKVKE